MGQTDDVDVATALGTYVEIVDQCAPGLLEGLYVVGSYALDDWHDDRSDIDIVAVMAEPATDDDAGNLRTAHALLTEHQPRPFVDGPYLAWGDLITPPMSLHRPWSLDGVLHHDGECFELSPVTWYTLATSGVTVRGSSVDRLGIYLDVDARVRFAVDNLASYWKALAADVSRVFEQHPQRRFDAASFEWCALGALRLHRTAFCGDVVSKRMAGEYGLEVTPSEFHDTLRLALEVRAGRWVDNEPGIGAMWMERSAAVIRWCVEAAEVAARPGV